MAASKKERERRHQAQLARIEQVQLVVGRGDRLRVDHEGTLLERARLLVEELHSHQATERGLAAFDRLLRRAEEHGPGRAPDIVAFIDAVCGHKPLSLKMLRGQPQDVGDDMIEVLDAYRHARLMLPEQVEGGPSRVTRVLARRTLADA